MIPSLPDDLREWPDDPAELFGVDENVDRKTLRRIYSRLVRKFKPEHFPEQFQRIRDSYEMLLSAVEWRERFQAEEADSADDEFEEPEFVEDNPGEALSETLAQADVSDIGVFNPHSTPRRAKSDDDVEAAWQTAINGDLNSAYRNLVTLRQRRAGGEELCIRLYWLLRMKPALDPERQPIEWLIKTLKHTGLSDWAFGLYQDAIREAPELVRLDASQSLLKTSAPVWQLAELARCHWSACAEMKDWSPIARTLETLRPAIENEDTETWARLLFTALDYLAWATDSRAEEAARAIADELQQYEHLQLTLSYEFDRFEMLQMLSNDCRDLQKYGPITRELQSVLQAGWTGFDSHMRRELLDIIEPWIANPAKSLPELDHLAKCSPATIERLSEMFQGLAYDPGWWDDDEAVEDVLKRGLLTAMSGPKTWQSYFDLRPALCVFCLNESLLLNRVEFQIANDRYAFGMFNDEFLHEMSEDVALDCLLKANLAFRS